MLRLLLTVCLVAACAAPTPIAEAPATPPIPDTSPASNGPGARPEISIDHVDVANPLVVAGEARTFENAVTVRLRDAAGRVIAEEHVTSRGESGRHNPYDAEIWLTREASGKLTVEAFEYSARDGSVRSLTHREVAAPSESMRVRLVFPEGDCTRFLSVERTVPKTVSIARLLTEALLRGPTDDERARGASTPFPAGSDVRSVILRAGVLTVDLNERLQNVGGACAATAIRESLTRTLRQLPNVERVVITAGGSEALALQP